MKLKTNKSMAKRVKITKNGKMIKRKAGQAHFNSRESGKTLRNKRRDVAFPGNLERTVHQLMPNA